MANNISLKEIIDFFINCPLDEPTAEEKVDFSFFDNVIPLIQTQKEQLSMTAPDLSIFTGIGIETDEVRNCSILSWFMNPYESHAQGSLFMKIFFREMEIDFIDFIQDGYFSVLNEISYGEKGRVDINIRSNNFWIIIEAKINASEQKDQIERYRNIIDSSIEAYGIKKEHTKVLFLTLSGYEPETGEADKCISWAEIAEMMKIFAKECKNDIVRSLALQYSRHLSYLIGD